MEQRSLRRALFRPDLEGGLFLERRQVITAAGFNEFLHRSRL